MEEIFSGAQNHILPFFQGEHMQLHGNSSHLVLFVPFLVKQCPLFYNFLFLAVFIAVFFSNCNSDIFNFLQFVFLCFSSSQLWRREGGIQTVLTFSPLRFLFLYNHYTQSIFWREISAKYKQARKLLKCTDDKFLQQICIFSKLDEDAHCRNVQVTTEELNSIGRSTHSWDTPLFTCLQMDLM